MISHGKQRKSITEYGSFDQEWPKIYKNFKIKVCYFFRLKVFRNILSSPTIIYVDNHDAGSKVFIYHPLPHLTLKLVFICNNSPLFGKMYLSLGVYIVKYSMLRIVVHRKPRLLFINILISE